MRLRAIILWYPPSGFEDGEERGLDHQLDRGNRIPTARITRPEKQPQVVAANLLGRLARRTAHGHPPTIRNQRQHGIDQMVGERVQAWWRTPW